MLRSRRKSLFYEFATDTSTRIGIVRKISGVRGCVVGTDRKATETAPESERVEREPSQTVMHPRSGWGWKPSGVSCGRTTQRIRRLARAAFTSRNSSCRPWRYDCRRRYRCTVPQGASAAAAPGGRTSRRSNLAASTLADKDVDGSRTRMSVSAGNRQTAAVLHESVLVITVSFCDQITVRTAASRTRRPGWCSSV